MKSKERMPRQAEKGFTLIELLVVVAILGVLAGVVVPNVSRFMGIGRNEAGLTELRNVQVAVTAMMADQGIASVTAGPVVPANATDDMTAWPSGTPLHGGAFGNYIQEDSTSYYYEVAGDGVVRGFWDAARAAEIGVDPAP